MEKLTIHVEVLHTSTWCMYSWCSIWSSLGYITCQIAGTTLNLSVNKHVNCEHGGNVTVLTSVVPNPLPRIWIDKDNGWDGDPSKGSQPGYPSVRAKRFTNFAIKAIYVSRTVTGPVIVPRSAKCLNSKMVKRCARTPSQVVRCQPKNRGPRWNDVFLPFSPHTMDNTWRFSFHGIIFRA